MSSHTSALQDLSLIVAADAGQNGMKAKNTAMTHRSVESINLRIRSGVYLMAPPCLLMEAHDQITGSVKISCKYLDGTDAELEERSVTD